MAKFSRIWLILLLVSLPMVMLAQNTNEPKVIKTEEGKFIIHKVEKGQTLYAISKMYSVTVEDIQKANPDIQEFGIRIDQTLRIPVSSVNKKEAKKSAIELSGDTIYHEVKKKETLYALSKKYEIAVEDIERFNPVIKETGLQIGMIVKLPSVPESKIESKSEEFQKPKTDSLILHEVMPKETLYSLSKTYNVSTDSIQMVNDGLQQGLQIGTSIRIPKKNPDFVLDSIWLRTDTVGVDSTIWLNKGDTIIIGVFLPFCIEQNASEQEENNTSEIYGLSRISIEFLRGFNMAFDSLKNLGHDLDVRYFDTQNDTAVCNKLLMSVDVRELDLIIGPLFQTNFKCIAKKAKSLGIPIVSPVKVSSSLLLNNRWVVKSYASSPSLLINMAEYIGANFSDSNLVIVEGGAKKDTRYANIFQKHLNNAVNDSIPVNKVWQASKSNLAKYITKGKHNYVALISSDEAFVSQSISVFYGLKDDETQITVFGLDSWQNFKSIGFDYLDSMNVTFPVQKNIDYSIAPVINFVSKYRDQYYTEPTEHVFSAFDVGMYFVESLYDCDGNWDLYIDNHKQNGLITRFDFVKIGAESGFENRGGFILEYNDFNLNLVR